VSSGRNLTLAAIEKRPFRELPVNSYPRPSAVRRHGRGGAEETLQGARRRWRGRGACDMGSAFVVLGAFYRPAIGELAAIAKAAVHIELPTMGVAIPLYYRAGVAALQPEVGPRGRRRGKAGRESERGGRNGAISCPLLPSHKRRKTGKAAQPWRRLARRFALLEGRTPSRASATRSPTRHASNTCGGARLLRPSAKASTYGSSPCQRSRDRG
jgi:hypothetical protein